jgi:HEAT repeat protein
VKDIALDVTQSQYLRLAALDVLTEFKKFDVTQVLLELAKKDISEQMQNAAIEYLAQTAKDKNKSIEALSVLFQSIPKHRKWQLETILYAVAEIGNDKAIDFLSKVARTHEDYDLRSGAVYYLGNIGGEKARSALHQILRGK